MTSKNEDKKTLIETEREFQKPQNSEKEVKGRVPDQQHRMKDQENLRK